MSAFFSRIGEAGFYGIIGMVVIFVVLGIIWGILEAFGIIGKKIAEKEPEKPDDDILLPEITDDSDEEIAAVTAAVYMLLCEEAARDNRAPSAFRVVAFKRGRV
ncbi:MAG: OadG family protein [Clostridia bacterium]|nr:OadG family protein [Clostridia bacterium]